MAEWKHPVVFREVKCQAVKNLLEIEGKIHQDTYGFTPLIFLNIFEDFTRQDNTKKINMQFSPFELLSLKAAVVEALKTNEVPTYRNYTGGKEHGKWISVNVIRKPEANEHSISLNMEKRGKLIAMIFNRYEAFAFTELLDEVYHAMMHKRDEIAWSKYLKIFQRDKTIGQKDDKNV